MEASLNRVWGIKRKRIQTALRGGVDRRQQVQPKKYWSVVKRNMKMYIEDIKENTQLTK